MSAFFRQLWFLLSVLCFIGVFIMLIRYVHLSTIPLGSTSEEHAMYHEAQCFNFSLLFIFGLPVMIALSQHVVPVRQGDGDVVKLLTTNDQRLRRMMDLAAIALFIYACVDLLALSHLGNPQLRHGILLVGAFMHGFVDNLCRFYLHNDRYEEWCGVVQMLPRAGVLGIYFHFGLSWGSWFTLCQILVLQILVIAAFTMLQRMVWSVQRA